MIVWLMDNVEFDTFALAASESVLSHCDFALEDFGNTVADAVLDFVFFDHATEAFSEAFDFKSFWYASYKSNGIDCRADFLQQSTDESRLVH